MNLSLGETFRALRFYIFALEYLEDKVLRFKDVTNADNQILSVNAGLDYKPERKKEQEEKEDN